MNNLKSKIKANYKFLLLAGFFILILFSPYHALLNGNLVADDASYLAHGFSLGLDFNLQYKDMITKWTTLKGTAAAHPIGPGLLAAPFISLFSIIDRVLGADVIQNHMLYQYSWSQFGFVLSSVFYFIFGIFLYKQALHELGCAINDKLLILFCSSFGLLFYVLYRPIMGHASEFCSLALFSFTAVKLTSNYLYEQRSEFKWFLLFSFSLFITLSIRPANINIILLFPIILLVNSMVNEKTIMFNSKLLLKNFSKLAISFVLIGGFFAGINFYLYDMVFPSATALYGANPNTMPALSSLADKVAAILILIERADGIIQIIFSSEFGLLYCSPLLLVGSLMLYYVVVKNPNQLLLKILMLLLVSSYIALPVAIILFWQSTGDAYGFRFLFNIFPIALLGYAIWNQRFSYELNSYYLNIYRVIRRVLICLCLFSLLANAFFGNNQKLLYQENNSNAFGNTVAGASGYTTEVAKSSISPQAWINLFANRVAGFYLVGVLNVLDIEHKPYGISEHKWQQFKCCYEFPPISSYIQAALIISLILLGLLVLL